MHAHPDHAHHHPETTGRLLWLATGFTLAYAGVEAGVGWWAGSLALVADAGHMVNDAAALALAAVAAWLARRPASARHSYGFGRAEFIAALVNSLGLLILVAWIAVSAVQRLHDPQPVIGEAVSLAAAAGLALNIGVAWLLGRGERNLNTRAALLHVLGDLLGSVAALLSGIVIAFTNWTPIDPLLSLGISALIVVSSLRLLREALHGLMEGTPFNLAPEEVGRALATVPGVTSVHDLHIWSVASEQALLSAHLVVRDLRQWETVLDACHALLAERFAIQHATLQPEPETRTVHWREPREPIGALPEFGKMAMKTRRLSLLLLAVVLVLTGAGLYRGLAPGSPSPTATTTPSATPTPGLPRLVELGSDSCAMCIAMQQVMAELRSNHPGRLEVVSINLRQYPEQAKVWKVKFIPTQVFLDGEGRELFRHVGYLPRQAVEERFAALGFALVATTPVKSTSATGRE